jgi:hypothetical protein
MNEKPLWRLVAGRKIGPYPPEKLRPLMKDGRISPLDRFSYDGTDWRAPTEFPELLREPSPVRTTAAPTGNPLDGDDAVSLELPAVEPQAAPRSLVAPADQAMDDQATKQLLTIIHRLIWVGAGVVVVLVVMMIVTTLLYSFGSGDSAAAPQPAAVPAAPAKPPATREVKEDRAPDEPPSKAEPPSGEVPSVAAPTVSGTADPGTEVATPTPDPIPRDIEPNPSPANEQPVPRRRVPVLP